MVDEETIFSKVLEDDEYKLIGIPFIFKTVNGIWLIWQGIVGEICIRSSTAKKNKWILTFLGSFCISNDDITSIKC